MTNWYKIAQTKGAPLPPPLPSPPPPPSAGGIPAPGGTGSAGPSEQRVGTVSGVDAESINDIGKDDKKMLKKLNKHFKNAIDSGHDIETSAVMAIMANGSTLSPGQLDIAETFDPEFPDQEAPFIRSVIGIHLGTKPPGQEAPPGVPPPPPGP